MNIVCIGGGPAGLYFALLMKRAHPAHRIRVVERNLPYDTFGWGVVFSDQTMDNMRRCDPSPSADEVQQAFNHWDDIELHFKDRSHPLGRPWLRRHRAQAAAQHPSAALRATGRGTRLRAGGRQRSRLPRRRPGHRQRRHQLQGTRAPRGGVQSRHRQATQPLHLAGHAKDSTTPSPSSSRRPSTAGSRRMSTSSTKPRAPSSSSAPRTRLARARAGSAPIRRPRSPSAKRLFASNLKGEQADEQCASPARLGVAELPARQAASSGRCSTAAAMWC
jgi:hypothetical protein